MHFAARPFRLSPTDIKMEIVEVALGLHLLQLQLFDCQLPDVELAFGIHAADELTRRRAGRRPSQKRRQKPLQPTWPRSWSDPAVQVRRIQLVRAQMKNPLWTIVIIGLCGLLDVSCPRTAKPFDSHHTRDTPSVDPVQGAFGDFQRLVQSRDAQICFAEPNPAVPPAGERLFPLPLNDRGGLSRQFPATIQLTAKCRGQLKEILRLEKVPLNTDASSLRI